MINAMDDKLTFKGLSKNEKPIILNELSSKKDSSLVASYYIALCLMDFDIDHPTIKAMHALEGSEGNLFVDYLLLKEKVISAGKEYIDRINYYTKLSPVIGALKELSNTLYEAKFLYADSLSVDLRALKDEKKAFELFKELYDLGHVGSALQLALLIYTEKSLKKHAPEIIEYLNYSYSHGAIYAAYLFYKIYSNGFYSIQKDSIKAEYWKKIFDEYKEENDLSDADTSLDINNDNEIIVEDDKPFDLVNEYHNAIKKNDNNVSLFNLLERIKHSYPLFYYSEYIRAYTRMGETDKARLYVPDFEKYLTRTVIKNHKDEIIKMYQDLYLFDRVKLLKENDELLSIDDARARAKDAEANKDIDSMIKYYNLCITLKDYNYYYKLFRLMEELKRFDEAIEYLKDGASLDNLMCTKTLGNMYLNGEIVKKDIAHAVDYLMSAYKKGDIESAFKLGYLLYEGKYVIENKPKGLELMRKAINSGYPDKNGDMSIVYFEEGNTKDAINYLEKKVSKYRMESPSSKLGEYYFNNKEYTKAKDYFLIASKYNNPSSLYHLGLIYKDGLLNTLDYQKAYDYFIKANMLGVTSDYEIGVCAYNLKKYEEAYKYLMQSSSADNPYGYYLLSELHYKKLIISHNIEDAKAYAKKAIKAGYKPSIKINKD